MRFLTALTRRRFGRDLGIALALAVPAFAATALGGPRHWRVQVRGFAFDPETITISAGDTVAWTNADLAPHTATAADGGWDTGSLDSGVSGQVRFDAAGDHRYACAYHPHMTGRVVVR